MYASSNTDETDPNPPHPERLVNGSDMIGYMLPAGLTPPVGTTCCIRHMVDSIPQFGLGDVGKMKEPLEEARDSFFGTDLGPAQREHQGPRCSTSQSFAVQPEDLDCECGHLFRQGQVNRGEPLPVL